jgi:gamma-glutamyltranspeptidase/glutathione hydrolase
LEDLARHEAAIVPPLASRIFGLHLHVAPPNSAGYALLQILSAVERLKVDPDPTGPDVGVHALIYLTALEDVRRHLADPDRMSVHVSTLLEDGHMAAFCDEVRDRPGAHGGTHREAPRPNPGGDTIGLVTADADGNVISLIQSLFEGFGSGILEPSTGIVAHDRGACFTLEEGHPNRFTPGALPAHTLLPAVVMTDAGPAGAAGTRGGYQQPQIDAQTITRAFVLGSPADDAVSAPRFEVGDLPDESPDEASLPAVMAESDIGAGAIEAIRSTGLTVTALEPHDGWMGPAQLVKVGRDSLEAGADPRSDGSALAG